MWPEFEPCAGDGVDIEPLRDEDQPHGRAGAARRGRAALAKRDWPAALESFQAACDQDESADALDA
jgi:hypothetical protein